MRHHFDSAGPQSNTHRSGNIIGGVSRRRHGLLGIALIGCVGLGLGCEEKKEAAFPGIDPVAAKAARDKAALEKAKNASANTTTAPVVTPPPQGTTGPIPGKSVVPSVPLLAANESPLPGPIDVAKLEIPGIGFVDAVTSGDTSLFTAMDRALSSVYPGSRTEDKAMRIKRSADGVVVLATVISSQDRPYAYDIRMLYASLDAMKKNDDVMANVAADVGEALKLVPKEIGLELSAKVGQLVEGNEVQPRTYAAPKPFQLVTEVLRQGEDRGFISVTLRLVDVSASTP